MKEKSVEVALRKWFKNKKELSVVGKQRKLPPPKGGDKSCKPDIIAYKEKGKKVYIVECKKSRSLRTIGHAFGQLYVDELVISRIPTNEWMRFLKKRTTPTIEREPDKVFGVAFPCRILKDKNARKIITEFKKRFRHYRVYIVWNKNKVREEKNGG